MMEINYNNISRPCDFVTTESLILPHPKKVFTGISNSIYIYHHFEITTAFSMRSVQ
jgi:hypothetical protein